MKALTKVAVMVFSIAISMLLLASAVAAVSETARIDSAQWSTSRAVNIGTTQVGPGTYKFEAAENGSTLFVERDGLLVSDVPCYWVKLPQKAEQLKVVADKDRVLQIEFPGALFALKVL
jgi:hypothetical protein